MTKDTQRTEQKPKTKRPRAGGRPPKITLDFCERVAVRLVDGMPLSFALRLENEQVTIGHFKKSLDKAPMLLARFEKKCGEALEPILAELNNCDLRHMPAKVWKIQRRFGEHFADPKAQGATPVNITVNACVGVDDSVSRRAAHLVKMRAVKPPTLVEIASPTQVVTTLATSGNQTGTQEPDHT